MSTEEKINEPARDEESPAEAWRESLGYPNCLGCKWRTTLTDRAAALTEEGGQ